MADQMQSEVDHTALNISPTEYMFSVASRLIRKLFVRSAAEYTLCTVPNWRQRTCADVALPDLPGETCRQSQVTLMHLSGPGAFQ